MAERRISPDIYLKSGWFGSIILMLFVKFDSNFNIMAEKWYDIEELDFDIVFYPKTFIYNEDSTGYFFMSRAYFKPWNIQYVFDLDLNYQYYNSYQCSPQGVFDALYCNWLQNPYDGETYGFGEVYTSLQQGIIDGAENNELALTDNGHGDAGKYYSYDMHQMVPDILIANYAFLEGLSEEERAIFEEGFKLINTVQREEWTKAVENAKNKAANEMGVQFYYPDVAEFQAACAPLHESVLSNNEALRPMYEQIQEYNAQYAATEE